MGEIALNKKPTAEDFEYAYTENSTGEIVRVPKEKILAIPEDKYVKITEQALTKEQQSQSRTNIGAASKEEVSQLSETIDGLKVGVNKDTITEAVNNYLEINPVKAGVTTEQANSLWAIIQKTAFATQLTETELTNFKTAFGIEGSGGTVTPDTPDEPTEKTLSSISATYTGGEVTVGTALTDLTGITATGTYSDGSTSAITGYTLSGEIVEGTNTITVTYNGLTTTFTVTGIAESGGDVEPLYTFESVENATINSRYNNGTGTLTISNGNHIKVVKETTGNGEWFWDINVSSFATHGQTVSNATDTLFTIPSGATVKLCAKNVNENEYPNVSARIALGATQAFHDIYSFIHISAQDVSEFTFSAEQDINVPCVTISIMPESNDAQIDLEFDVEIYVDGVRWI